LVVTVPAAALALPLAICACSSEPEGGGEPTPAPAPTIDASDDPSSDTGVPDAAPDLPGPGDSGADRVEGDASVDGDARADAPSDSPADASDSGDGGPVTPFHYFDLNHTLCTGQSLSVGSSGSPPLSTTQPYKNKMFNSGVLAGATNLLYFVPLVESGVETMSSGMANLVTKMARDEVFTGSQPPQNSHEVLVSCHGVGGTAYSGLKKGTAPYAAGMAQVKAAKTIGDFYGLSYVVRAVTNVHGESDHIAGNTHYAADLTTWQSDYETDVKAATGQNEPVPMLHTQFSSWTKFSGTTSAVVGAQLDASVAKPDKIILVGPKYFLAYAPDGVHLSNAGYRHMGEYYAKVYRHAILEGQAWQPLRPTAAALSGTTVTVTFHVPVPPLVIDTALVTDPGHDGFEYSDDSASPAKIASVALDGATKVEIALDKAPTGAKKRIRYAWTGQLGAGAGPKTGPRGNLRDSDAATSLAGNKLYNWAVHFDMAVQ
jgi:hypothetical protein